MHTRPLALLILLGSIACQHPQAAVPAPNPAPLPPSEPARAVPPAPVLADHLLVTWYGNPRSSRMGVLGRHRGAELAAGLRKQAAAYAALTKKKVMAAYHLVAVIAQPHRGKDGMSRRRETDATIRAMLDEARAHQFKLILDVQPGHSTVKAELAHLRQYLEDPDVYLGLDPEFAMPADIAPGRRIGRMTSADVNDAIDFLEAVVRARQLPPKVLIVHQFTMNMLGEKQKIRDSALVDVVLDVDGFGDRPLKRAMYQTIIRKPLEYPGIKLFYREDTNLLGEADVMKLKPEPAVVIYQ
jgi:hypothetical protein